MFRAPILPCLAALLLAAGPARAEVTIGAVLSLTGAAADAGSAERNVVALLPEAIAGQSVRWVVLDDGSDAGAAVKAARRLIDEEHVDAIIGASTLASSLAMLDVVGAAGVPTVSLAGSAAVIEPPDGPRRWVFKPAPGERVVAAGITGHMLATGRRTLAHIGFANALGDGYVKALADTAAGRGIRTVADVRYDPADTDITPQVLRVLAAQPDAVFVAATAAAIVELRAHGYGGPIYAVQGIAGADALRVGGHGLDGTLFAAVPVVVAEQLAPGAPVRDSAMAYVAAYEGRYGSGSRSLAGAAFWDAFQLVAAAAPAALADGKPGTPQFRAGLRTALEAVHGLAAAEAVFTLSARDHGGAQADSQVMVEIRDGAYRLLPAPEPPPAPAAAPKDVPAKDSP